MSVSRFFNILGSIGLTLACSMVIISIYYAFYSVTMYVNFDTNVEIGFWLGLFLNGLILAGFVAFTQLSCSCMNELIKNCIFEIEKKENK